jgi:hypothetical protein
MRKLSDVQVRKRHSLCLVMSKFWPAKGQRESTRQGADCGIGEKVQVEREAQQRMGDE